MKLYSNVYDYAIYAENGYCEDWSLILLAHSKTHNHCAYAVIIIICFKLFFFNVYKNE